jgi:hypothetical protein
VQIDPLHVWESTGPIITGLFTAIFGLLGYVLGQVFLKLIEPALEFRARIGAIARDLILYANRNVAIADDSTRLKIFREHAAVIHESLFKIPFYDQIRLPLQLPPREDVEAAAAELIGLSNLQLGADVRSINYNPWERMQNIRKLLRITPVQDPPKSSLEKKLEIPKMGDISQEDEGSAGTNPPV